MASTSTPRPRPRWRTTSLRTFMLLIVIVGGWLGWICYRAREQREAVAAIEAAGGEIWFDWRWTDDWEPLGKPSWLRTLLRRQLGPGFFEEVTMVNVLNADDALMVHIGCLGHLQMLIATGRNLTDAGLAPLTGLADLRDLSLLDTGITDAGVARIGGLTNLRELSLSHTPITDAGLARLAGLKRCQAINVFDTQVTPEGAAALKRKCQWMTIGR